MTPRRALKWLLSVLMAAFALVAAALLVGMVIIPLFTGWVPLTVLSGSMEPTYPVGSQVYVERIDSHDKYRALKPGDVISLMPKPNDTTMVTHRIVSVEMKGDGTRTYRTKGDANNSVDQWVVEEKMVRAKVHYCIPYAGYIARYLDGDAKKTGVIVAATVLFAYAGWQFASAARGRARDRRRQQAMRHRMCHEIEHREREEVRL